MQHSLIALALLVLLPLSAQAGELSYTHVELDYVNVDGDAHGFGLKGSLNFGDSDFYGFASHNQIKVNGTSFDIDASDIGFGYHYALNDRAHLISEVAYAKIDTDFGNVDGYRASVGVRGVLAGKLEGVLKANYVDGNDLDSDVTGTAGLEYRFTPTWGAVTEVEFTDGGERTYLAGVRASF